MRNSWRRKRLWPLLTVAALVILALQWKLDIHWGTQAHGITPSPASPSPAPSPTPIVVTNPVRPEVGPLSEQIREEADRIGKPTEQPKRIEEQLDRWGQSLTPSQIQELKALVQDSRAPGDVVAVSLDLLGRSNAVAAEEALVDYVLHPPAIPHEGFQFQALALEGLIDQAQRNSRGEALQKVRRESPDSWVAQRAQQALGALAGRNRWPKETDEKTLTELLEKTAR